MARPRKPTSLKILEGDRKDRINRSEPKSPEGLGEPPEWLDDLGRSAWSRLVGLLGPMKVATRADSEAAMLYCEHYSTMRRAKALIEEHGMLIVSVTNVETKHGLTTKSVSKETIRANPLLATMRESMRQMMTALGHFGLTPSSRAGLKVEAESDDDALMEFLRNRTGRNARRKGT